MEATAAAGACCRSRGWRSSLFQVRSSACFPWPSAVAVCTLPSARSPRMRTAAAGVDAHTARVDGVDAGFLVCSSRARRTSRSWQHSAAHLLMGAVTRAATTAGARRWGLRCVGGMVCGGSTHAAHACQSHRQRTNSAARSDADVTSYTSVVIARVRTSDVHVVDVHSHPACSSFAGAPTLLSPHLLALTLTLPFATSAASGVAGGAAMRAAHCSLTALSRQ
jgi:hypothetical protein